MANLVFMGKTGLTGGEATKLDSIDGDTLTDNDAAFVNVSNVQYIYRLDADSGAAESSPNIIAPDTNAGNKRWILQTMTEASLILSGLTASLPVFTDGSKNLVSNAMTGTGKVVMDTSPTIAGHATIEGVTFTGATGTGKLVCDTSPTLVTPTIGAASGTSLTLSGLTASLPVFTDGSKKLVSKSVADTLTALGVGVWTDYTSSSTITGWSSKSASIRYKVIDKLCFVFFNIGGTSNANYASFTLPNALRTGTGFDLYVGGIVGIDNGTQLSHSCVVLMTAGYATVNIYKEYGSTTWTTSGTKMVKGTFFYELA